MTAVEAHDAVDAHQVVERVVEQNQLRRVEQSNSRRVSLFVQAGITRTTMVRGRGLDAGRGGRGSNKGVERTWTGLTPGLLLNSCAWASKLALTSSNPPQSSYRRGCPSTSACAHTPFKSESERNVPLNKVRLSGR